MLRRPQLLRDMIAGHPLFRFGHAPQTRTRGLRFACQWRGWFCLVTLALIAGGCVRLPKTEQKAEVKSLQQKGSESITPTTLQASVMRFADEYSLMVVQAS